MGTAGLDATTLIGLLFVATAGCDARGRNWFAPVANPPAAPLTDADSAFNDPRPRGEIPGAPHALATAAPLPQTDVVVVLSVLQVRIPQSARAEAQKLWNHLREDGVPAETALALRRNGVRVGLGQAQFWDAIKAVIDNIEGHAAEQLEPVRLPLRYPLGLELDREPHDQTVFFVDADGVLRGATWAQSRNVLVVTCFLDPQHADRVVLSAIPEVRQRLPGLRWVNTPLGLGQEPRYDGRAYPAAGIVIGLNPGEYLVIAPSENADIDGIVGGAFLNSESAGRRYDAYLFLRPEVTHGGRHN
jgi:hypothetical protein